MIGLSTQVLLSSSPGLCHPIAHLSSTSTTQAGDEYFFPGKQRKPCIHSIPVALNQELASMRISHQRLDIFLVVMTKGRGDNWHTSR